MSSTRKQVAQQAGVSEATVSRVFSDAVHVQSETKRKVLQAAEALGYYPNALAQSFARKKSMNIGIVLPYIPKVRIFSYDYFSDILSGASEAARQAGYDLVLFYRNAGQKEVDYRSYYHNKKVDGCLLLGTFISEQDHLLQMVEEDYPLVLVSNALENQNQIYTIDANHVQGSYDAICHLIDQGHQRIAFLNGPEDYANSQERSAGVRKAFLEFSHTRDYWFTGNFSRTSGYRFADQFIHIKPRPTALFAANDRMAIGFMQRLREMGIQPGDDVAIVGYDDSEIAEYMYPTLTSVSVPFFEMGRQAVTKLIQQFDANQSSVYEAGVQLQTELKIRSSSTKFVGTL